MIAGTKNIAIIIDKITFDAIIFADILAPFNSLKIVVSNAATLRNK
jgi:hypothetical protein